jgi:hypothetical protein
VYYKIENADDASESFMCDCGAVFYEMMPDEHAEDICL